MSGGPIYKHTRVIARFYSDEGFDGEVTLSSPTFGRLVGFTWQKSFGGASGSWTLTFKRGTHNADPMMLWRDPEDTWVRIDVLVDGRRRPVVLGLIDTISEQMQRDGSGGRDETYTISGRDFGKVFETTELYINIYEQEGALPIVPLMSALQDRIRGGPGQVIGFLMDAWLGNDGAADRQWTVPRSLGGGLNFFGTRASGGLLNYRPSRALRGEIFEPNLYSPDRMMGRRFWDTMQEYSNGILNELYCDLRPVRQPGRIGGFGDSTTDEAPAEQFEPVLALRERPFPTYAQGRRKWDSLPTVRLTPGMVQSRRVTKGGPEARFNYWLLRGMGFGGDGVSSLGYIQQQAAVRRGYPGSAPIYNLDSIRKHGFRKWEQPTRYFPFREDPQWLLHSSYWLRMLHDWYVVAPFQLSGQIQTTYIQPDIRIGNRVREVRRDGEEVIYYVEGVEHTYDYAGGSGRGATTLTVTRGEFAEEDLLHQYYQTITTVEQAETRLDQERVAALRRLSRGALSDTEIILALNSARGRTPDQLEESADAVEDANDPLRGAQEAGQTGTSTLDRDARDLGGEGSDAQISNNEIPSDVDALTADEDIDAASAQDQVAQAIDNGEPLPEDAFTEAQQDAGQDQSRGPEDRPQTRQGRTTNPRGRTGGR